MFEWQEFSFSILPVSERESALLVKRWREALEKGLVDVQNIIVVDSISGKKEKIPWEEEGF